MPRAPKSLTPAAAPVASSIASAAPAEVPEIEAVPLRLPVAVAEVENPAEVAADLEVAAKKGRSRKTGAKAGPAQMVHKNPLIEPSNRAPSPYILFSKARQPVLRGENPGIGFEAISHQVSADWQGLTADEKALWVDKAREGAEVVKAAYQAYRAFDPPRRPVTPYIAFYCVQREALSKEHTFKEVAALVGARWQALSEADRQPFVAARDLALQQYALDIAEWQEMIAAHIAAHPEQVAVPKLPATRKSVTPSASLPSSASSSSSKAKGKASGSTSVRQPAKKVTASSKAESGRGESKQGKKASAAGPATKAGVTVASASGKKKTASTAARVPAVKGAGITKEHAKRKPAARKVPASSTSSSAAPMEAAAVVVA